MKIEKCKNCGFILNTRPNLLSLNGVCSACINHGKKKYIDFNARQSWLTEYIKENKKKSDYDCAVAVSGGKDSTTIVRKLFENHGVKKALLITMSDHFTHTETGRLNLKNIQNKYDCDLISYEFSPNYMSSRMREDFDLYLNPLKYLESQIYEKVISIASSLDINLVFFGENAEFEYGSSEELEIFHAKTSDKIKVIYMGAIYSYSAQDWYEMAKEVGFKDLNYLNEWQRAGQIENYSQVDSIGYNMGVWTKFVKFGFQRVSDMACRFVRDGVMSYNEAQQLISEQDYICDPAAKRDFCRTIGITESHFDKMVDKHANKNLVVKDINGRWRRKDMIDSKYLDHSRYEKNRADNPVSTSAYQHNETIDNTYSV